MTPAVVLDEAVMLDQATRAPHQSSKLSDAVVGHRSGRPRTRTLQLYSRSYEYRYKLYSERLIYHFPYVPHQVCRHVV